MGNSKSMQSDARSNEEIEKEFFNWSSGMLYVRMKSMQYKGSERKKVYQFIYVVFILNLYL